METLQDLGNFFEHLPDKDALRRTLQEALRCLKDGGRIICIGPNIRFLGGAYWDFWDHFLPLTDRSMVEILTLGGFAVERVEPRFLPYSMSQGFTPPIGLISLYIRLPLLWRILGKQFLLVGRKALCEYPVGQSTLPGRNSLAHGPHVARQRGNHRPALASGNVPQFAQGEETQHGRDGTASK